MKKSSILLISIILIIVIALVYNSNLKKIPKESLNKSDCFDKAQMSLQILSPKYESKISKKNLEIQQESEINKLCTFLKELELDTWASHRPVEYVINIKFDEKLSFYVSFVKHEGYVINLNGEKFKNPEFGNYLKEKFEISKK